MENFRERFLRSRKTERHGQRAGQRTAQQRPGYQYDHGRAYEEAPRYNQQRYEEAPKYTRPVYEEAFYNDAPRYEERRYEEARYEEPRRESYGYEEPYEESYEDSVEVSERLEEIEAKLNEYAAMLRAIRESSEDNEKVAEAIERLEGSQASIKEAIEDLKVNNVEASVNHALEENNSKLIEVLEANKNDTVDQITDVLESQKEEYKELVHYENVKVYRNVQAVVVDEAGKAAEKVTQSEKNITKKINVAIAFGAIAMISAFLNLAFNILTKFGVF